MVSLFGLGPALGCKNLRKYTDKSQTRLAIDLHADNVGSVHETLRSSTRLVIAHRTTSADFRDLVDSSHKVRNSLAEWAPSPGEHKQDGMLHGFSCLPRARAAAPVAQACCPATEFDSYCSNRYHIEDRLSLTTSHQRSPRALHSGRQMSR